MNDWQQLAAELAPALSELGPSEEWRFELDDDLLLSLIRDEAEDRLVVSLGNAWASSAHAPQRRERLLQLGAVSRWHSGHAGCVDDEGREWVFGDLAGSTSSGHFASQLQALAQDLEQVSQPPAQTSLKDPA